MKKVFIAFAIIIGLFYWLGQENHTAIHSDIPNVTWESMSIQDDPIQTNLQDKPAFVFGEYTLKPLAEFNVAARVLGKERYRLDRESDLAPWDFALGWGPMTDDTLLDTLTINQSNRWYHWRTPKLITTAENISHHSANMHIIPANARVESNLSDVQKDDQIQISGYLVQVRHPDSFYWRSSMSRTDTGQGACEVILVTGVRSI